MSSYPRRLRPLVGDTRGAYGLGTVGLLSVSVPRIKKPSRSEPGDAASCFGSGPRPEHSVKLSRVVYSCRYIVSPSIYQMSWRTYKTGPILSLFLSFSLSHALRLLLIVQYIHNIFISLSPINVYVFVADAILILNCPIADIIRGDLLGCIVGANNRRYNK